MQHLRVLFVVGLTFIIGTACATPKTRLTVTRDAVQVPSGDAFEEALTRSPQQFLERLDPLIELVAPDGTTHRAVRLTRHSNQGRRELVVPAAPGRYLLRVTPRCQPPYESSVVIDGPSTAITFSIPAPPREPLEVLREPALATPMHGTARWTLRKGALVTVVRTMPDTTCHRSVVIVEGGPEGTPIGIVAIVDRDALGARSPVEATALVASTPEPTNSARPPDSASPESPRPPAEPARPVSPAAPTSCDRDVTDNTCTPHRNAMDAAERGLRGLAELSHGRIRTVSEQRRVVEDMRRTLAGLADPAEYRPGSREWREAMSGSSRRADLTARLPGEQKILESFERADAELSRAREQLKTCEERVAMNKQVCDAEAAERLAAERKQHEEAERRREANRHAEELKAKRIKERRLAESSPTVRRRGLTTKEKRALEVEWICEPQFNKTVETMEAYCSSLPSHKYEFCTSQAWELARESRLKCYRQGGVEPPDDGLD